jgi:hypothetical protein
MSLLTNGSSKVSVRSLETIGLAVLGVWLCLPVNLFGESLIRTISLKATDQEQNIRIPVGSSVTFLNDYPQKLYETVIITDHSNKKLLSIESFAPGQSFGLQFSKKGPYSICYSLKPKTDSANSICLPINVVPLQTV